MTRPQPLALPAVLARRSCLDNLEGFSSQPCSTEGVDLLAAGAVLNSHATAAELMIELAWGDRVTDSRCRWTIRIASCVFLAVPTSSE
jgi:hypothetical protein